MVKVPKACDELFRYAMDFVSHEDISAFCPKDPGYADYVREWRQMLATRSFPAELNFDIKETVGLTRWSDPEQRGRNPIRFRRFRIFTNAVALGMAASDQANDDDFPPNYTLISLIDDTKALQDGNLFRLLPPAFDEAYEAWCRQASDESVFALLALLLLQARQGGLDVSLDASAERLIQQDIWCLHRVHGGFVFGRTYYDQLNHLWKQRIGDWIQPTSETLALVRDSLLDS